MRLAHLVGADSKKNERRLPDLSRESKSVSQVRAEQQMAQDAVGASANDTSDTQALRLKGVEQQVEKKIAELAQKKRAIAEAAVALQTRRSMRAFSLGELGQGPMWRWALPSTEERLRMVQRSMGRKAVSAYNESWLATSATWMQKVLDESGMGDPVAFSQPASRDDRNSQMFALPFVVRRDEVLCMSCRS